MLRMLAVKDRVSGPEMPKAATLPPQQKSWVQKLWGRPLSGEGVPGASAALWKPSVNHLLGRLRLQVARRSLACWTSITLFTGSITPPQSYKQPNPRLQAFSQKRRFKIGLPPALAQGLGPEFWRFQSGHLLSRNFVSSRPCEFGSINLDRSFVFRVTRLCGQTS